MLPAQDLQQFADPLRGGLVSSPSISLVPPGASGSGQSGSLPDELSSSEAATQSSSSASASTSSSASEAPPGMSESSL